MIQRNTLDNSLSSGVHTGFILKLRAYSQRYPQKMWINNCVAANNKKKIRQVQQGSVKLLVLNSRKAIKMGGKNIHKQRIKYLDFSNV